MQFADDARRVFFGYALPCLNIKVAQKKIDTQTAKELIEKYANCEELPEGTERLFSTAMERCAKTARSLNKNKIDAEAVRHYFLFEHNNHVDMEAKLGLLKKPDYCKVTVGYILKVDKLAHVKKDDGTDMYKIELFPNIEPQTYVAVHRGYISDIIDKSLVEKVLEQKGLNMSCLGV
ncbi:MAG: hypothetical protein KQA33_03000 [Candidatus Aenigmarchaeota archaeon]|nr:hypothetical protein [Candidatus Aenigmarchaeota archaeon]